MADIKSHTRIINTFTGPAERRFLQWMAARLPLWVTPDVLTGVGVLGALIVALSYYLTNFSIAFLWLASLGLLINWYGDSLDGTTARFRHIERPSYGFYVDHVVDAFIIVLIFIGAGLSPFVRFNLACLALVGYLLLSVLVYIRTCVRGEFAISYGKLGPTEARLIGVGINAVVYFTGNHTLKLFSIKMSVFDWLAIGLIVLLFGICLSTAFQQGRILAEQDGKLLLQRTTHSEHGPSSD